MNSRRMFIRSIDFSYTFPRIFPAFKINMYGLGRAGQVRRGRERQSICRVQLTRKKEFIATRDASGTSVGETEGGRGREKRGTVGGAEGNENEKKKKASPERLESRVTVRRAPGVIVWR